MSSFSVINGVSRTLATFLQAATGVAVNNTQSPLTVAPGGDPLIHLYLYRVERNPFFAGNDDVRPTAASRQLAPLGLNLFYLLTPYGNDNELQVQITLGEVLQVLHDTPLVPTIHFDPAVRDTTEELRVIHHPLPLDTMIDFWRSFDGRSYRLSTTLEVSAVTIDSTRVRTIRRVEERNVDVATLR